MEANLPVTFLYWLVALSPLVLILILLVWARWSAPEAGPIGLLAGVLTAMLIFRTPLDTIAIAAGKGVWDAIFILYVIWPALFLYQATKQAGGFQAMRLGIQEHSKSGLFLVLAFGWVFASFLQGITGFGAPIAIVAPLLVGLGVKPVMAVVIPLIGHAWANLFGTLAVAWLATTRVVTLENPSQTALDTAWMLWIPNLLAGFAIAWLYGRWQGVKVGFWAIIVISLIHGGGQLLLSQVDPTLANFIPATVALGALFLLARLPQYRERSIEESPVMQEEQAKAEEEERPKMSLNEAFLPYYVLIATTLIVLGIPAIRGILEQWEIGLPFPRATTGYGMENEAESPYSPFSVITHPGTFLLLSAVVAYFWFRAKGHYEERPIPSIISGAVKNGVPASVAVVAFLAMSQVLDHSGQVAVLALGIAAISPPIVYAGLANFIGILGSFMTSSNTASNILFAPLQEQTAEALTGLSEPVVIAAQNAGGAVGNSIAPANVVLGTGTAGIPGKEGEVLRYTLVFALASGVLMGLLAIIFFLAT